MSKKSNVPERELDLNVGDTIVSTFKGEDTVLTIEDIQYCEGYITAWHYFLSNGTKVRESSLISNLELWESRRRNQ